MESTFLEGVLFVSGLTGGLYLNEEIYNKKLFLLFIPISIVLISGGILASSYFENNIYKIFIIYPIFIYLIKLTQILCSYFSIRGTQFM